MFILSFGLMLFYDAITLRDILLVRMGMFSVGFCEATPPRSILDILSDTLTTIERFFRLQRNKQSPSMLNLGLRGNRESDGTE